MPTFQFQKQAMAQGESRTSDEFTAPDHDLVELKMELTMNANEMKDPTTDVIGHLDYFDEAGINDWRPIASVQLTGSPLNTKAGTPYVSIGKPTLTFLVNKRVRARIEAISSGSYGATLTWN